MINSILLDTIIMCSSSTAVYNYVLLQVEYNSSDECNE